MAIAVSLILTLSFTAMASETVRDTVIGEKIETLEGIDNSQLLATDLESFDLEMTITDVTQDNKNHYIDYQFKILAIKDNIWQSVLREQRLTVSKAFLLDRDLGLYVQEEIGEVADYELSHLKEVQDIQKTKGKTEIVKTTKYTGLIGLVLNIKDKVLLGYEPVVKPPVSQIAQVFEPPATNPEPAEEQSVVTNPEVLEDPLVPPETIIDSHPLPATTSFEATFIFYSSEQNAFFQCKINSGDWQNCASPKIYSGLVPGDYIFQVFATDSQGNYDDTSAIFSWIIIEEDVATTTETIVDNTPPDTIIDSYPLELTSSTEAIFSFHATKENCQFTCKIDTEFWQGCESPITYTDLFIGNHQFQVQAIDSGNQEDPMPALFEWQVLAPTTTDQTIATTTQEIVTQTTSSSTDVIINSTSTEPIINTSSTDEIIISTSTDGIATSTDNM